MKKGAKVWSFIVILTVVGLMFSGLIDTTSATTEATTEKTTVSVTDLSPWFTKGTHSGYGPWYPHPKKDPDYISTYVGGMSWLGLGDSRSDPDCWAKFKPYLSQPGEYEVSAYFYAGKNTSTIVPFTVRYDGGTETIKVDQYSSIPTWKEESLGTWNFKACQDSYVEVTDATGEPCDNIKGLTIGAIKFMKKETVLTPVVTGIDPSQPTASPAKQWITIKGTGFVSDSTVTLRIGSSTYPIPAGRTEFKSSTQIRVKVGLTDPGTWSARVINPGNRISNRFSFTVKQDIPSPVHGMAVTNVYTSPDSPNVDQLTTIYVTVKNKGDQQEKDVPVKAYVEGYQVGSAQYVTLTDGKTTKSFTWTPSTAKTYSVKGEVGVVSGETETSDNTKTINVVVNPSPPQLDLRITDIKPIQTIQDIPLIKDKATMVRVSVDLAPEDIEELPDVTVELEFEGKKYYETANLIRYDGNVYVVPDDKLENFKKFPPIWKKQMLFDYGLDAFNFEYEDIGTPKNEGTIPIKAMIDPSDKFNEINENNNFMNIDKKVKSFKKNFKVIFKPLSFWGSRKDFTDYNKLADFAEYQFEYFISTYPIPRINSDYKFDPSILPAPGLSIPTILVMSAVYKVGGYERVIYLIPEGKILSIAKFLPGSGEPPKGVTLLYAPFVLIDETAPQHIMAHEMGHTYGYCEEYDVLPIPGWITPECGDWNEDVYPLGYIAGDGWDVRGMVFSKEDKRAKISLDKHNPALADYNYFSFMGSPVGSAWQKNFNWAPSNNNIYNTYNTLLEKLDIGVDPRVLVVSGLIHENDTVEFLPFYSFNGTPDILDSGNYSFECISLSNEVLSNVSFKTYYFTDTQGKNISPFLFTIPYPSNTAKIVLKHYNTILKEVLVTPNMPVIEIISLNDLGNETYEIIWNASDADGDVLTYSISYSHNSNDWFPLVFNSSSTDFKYIFNTSNLPGGNNSVIKIITTDGVNTVEAISDPFTVGNKAPFAFITLPINGSIFSNVSNIGFEAGFYDPEDKIDNSFWYSNIDGFLGNGSVIYRNLSLGEHEITFTVVDREGLSGTDSINIVIPTEIKPDLSVNNITFNHESVVINETVLITAEISNIITDAFCDIAFYDGDPDSGGVLIANTSTFAIANLLTYVPTTHNFSSTGAHDVYVVISNSDPEESNTFNNKAFKRINVTENQLPITSFTYSPPHPIVNQSITFNASSSYDPDGNITNYEWNFGDGIITNTTDPLITHTYVSAGNYTVNLTVTDDEGEYSYTESSITIKAPVFYVPDDYPSIQAAVDAASAGDTIIVRYGTYTENVDIDKSITLKSSSGNPGNTIVQAANPNDHIFEITADYVNISGFTVGGAAVCIFLNEVNYCNISNNHILNYTGIHLNYSNDNIIMNNNFSKSDDGILLDSSNSNTVFNNTFSGYSLYSLGIGLKNSTNNLISDNTICNCPHGGIELGFASSNNIILNNTFKSCGLCVWRYETNTVEGNTVNDKPLIYLENVSQIVVDNAGQVILANCEHIKVIGCNLSSASIGVDLLNSSNCVIENNICRDNFCGGIDLFDYSSNNIVLNNIIDNNFWGIFLTSYASNNTIVNNICENNYFGIHLSDTNNNRIYLNNLNNDCNVQSYNSCNIWNSKEKITYSCNGESHTKYLGNYWSDYTGTDANKNGIGDSPYSIDDRGGDIDQDYYPLMTWSEDYFNPPPHPLPMPPPTSTLTPTPRPTLTLAPRPTPTLAPRPTPTLAPRPTPTLAPRPTPTLAPRPTLRPTATLFEKIEGLTTAIRVGVGI